MAKQTREQDQSESALTPPAGPLTAAQLRRLSSQQLAWRAKNGCRAAFAELVRRYSSALLQFLRHRNLSSHDAEDLLQETFIRAYTNIHRFRPCCSFSAWLFTIAARLAASHHRAARSTLPLPTTAAHTPTPDGQLAQTETAAGLWALARQLPLLQYQSLYLRYARQMSIKQIAKTLGKTQISIKVLLHRARLNLAEKLLASPLAHELHLHPRPTKPTTKHNNPLPSIAKLEA